MGAGVGSCEAVEKELEGWSEKREEGLRGGWAKSAGARGAS
jgi:hypothetical protein